MTALSWSLRSYLSEDLFVAQQFAKYALGSENIASSLMIELGDDLLPFLDLATRTESFSVDRRSRGNTGAGIRFEVRILADRHRDKTRHSARRLLATSRFSGVESRYAVGSLMQRGRTKLGRYPGRHTHRSFAVRRRTSRLRWNFAMGRARENHRPGAWEINKKRSDCRTAGHCVCRQA